MADPQNPQNPQTPQDPRPPEAQKPAELPEHELQSSDIRNRSQADDPAEGQRDSSTASNLTKPSSVH